MKIIKFFVYLSFLLIFENSFSQSHSYIYGGYKVGRFLYVESPIDNLSTKFNLGWDIGITEDKGMVSLQPGKTAYSITNKMNYVNIPHGTEFGVHFHISEMLGVQLGMNYLNNTVSGSRTNLKTGLEESLSLKSHTGSFTTNITFVLNKYFHPYVGFELGRTYVQYNYSNGSTEIEDQLLGYRQKFMSIATVVGDKELTISTNVGMNVLVYEMKKLQLRVQPNFQYRIDKSIKIDQGVYYPMLFNHSNYSLSVWLGYGL